MGYRVNRSGVYHDFGCISKGLFPDGNNSVLTLYKVHTDQSTDIQLRQINQHSMHYTVHQ